MRRFQLITYMLVVALLAGCVSTGGISGINRHKGISEKQAFSDISVETPFPVDKKFTYLVAWNGIPVGRVMAWTEGVMTYMDREVLVIKLVTESNEFLSKIYRVEDVYISYVDKTDFISARYEADRKEGSYRKHVIVEYDMKALTAVYTNLTDGSVKECPIREKVQDPLSLICYFMTRPVQAGEKVSFSLNLNEKNYDVLAEVEKIEVVTLPHGEAVPAFRIRPYVELDGKRYEKGRAWGYVSADSRRYPLYGIVKIPFGKVTASLVSVEDVATNNIRR
ncbi:MAG: DUF3108 domain-containing protein [Candidatus Omnitrophica bacterium]|nr:DUF3108 domain-containing protein [Candidatus Omnitrophota bacterium]